LSPKVLAKQLLLSFNVHGSNGPLPVLVGRRLALLSNEALQAAAELLPIFNFVRVAAGKLLKAGGQFLQRGRHLSTRRHRDFSLLGKELFVLPSHNVLDCSNLAGKLLRDLYEEIQHAHAGVFQVPRRTETLHLLAVPSHLTGSRPESSLLQGSKISAGALRPKNLEKRQSPAIVSVVQEGVHLLSGIRLDRRGLNRLGREMGCGRR
jgi:hypothetical protein